MKSIVVSIFALSLVYGCAGGTRTTDPRKGGLFSYNPQAYERRLDDRNRELDRIELDTQTQKQKTARLQQGLATEKQRLAVLNRDLTYLDNSLNTIQQRLNRTRSTASSSAKKQQLESRIRSTKKAIWRMQRNVGSASNAGYSAKQVEYQRLKKERDLLLKEAELLERL